MSRLLSKLITAAVLGVLTVTAAAQEPVLPGAPDAQQGTPGGQADVKPEEGAGAGIWQRSDLLGDLGGLRPGLATTGVSFGLQETSEVLGNLGGGIRRAVVYEGVTQMGVGVDLEKAVALAGGTLNVSGFQIHGRGVSINALIITCIPSAGSRHRAALCYSSCGMSRCYSKRCSRSGWDRWRPTRNS